MPIALRNGLLEDIPNLILRGLNVGASPLPEVEAGVPARFFRAPPAHEDYMRGPDPLPEMTTTRGERYLR